MNRNEAPCALRALRELGYKWRKIGTSYDRREEWALDSNGDDLQHADVYWNGDGHDVRMVVGSRLVAEECVGLFRGPTARAVELRARAIMAKFRTMAEVEVTKTPWWTVIKTGGNSKQRRKVRRWGARCIAAARAEARKVAP